MKVKSSFIDDIEYDHETKVMRVAMKSGKVYDHPDIPADRHAELMAAPSIGKHYYREFKSR